MFAGSRYLLPCIARDPWTSAIMNRLAVSGRSLMNFPEYMKTVVMAPGAMSLASRTPLPPARIWSE